VGAQGKRARRIDGRVKDERSNVVQILFLSVQVEAHQQALDLLSAGVDVRVGLLVGLLGGLKLAFLGLSDRGDSAVFGSGGLAGFRLASGD